MDETLNGDPTGNSGQLNNQEIADLATEAVNNYLFTTTMAKIREITSRRRNVYSYDELGVLFPEYLKQAYFPINNLATVNPVLGTIPEDYVFFVSAFGSNAGQNSTTYRYCTPYLADRMRQAIFQEDRSVPYIIIQGEPGSGQVQALRPLASSDSGSGSLTMRYIAKQKDARIVNGTTQEEILLNSFHDSLILQEMVRLFENKQRQTE